MKPGQKHSLESRKKISEKTRAAVKKLNPNATAFKPGHQPWNTGLKGLTGSNSGTFKAGHKPHNWKPVGTIVTKRTKSKYGYVYEAQYKKIAEGDWERITPFRALQPVENPNRTGVNSKPIGTISTRRYRGYEYQYIKTQSSWKRYYPEGKSQKNITIKNQSSSIKKLFDTPNIKVKKSKVFARAAAPKPIVKSKEDIAAEKKIQEQKDFLAQFGITDSVISFPTKRGTEQ